MSRIIFMGTPEFAVPVLATLTQTQHEIVGVFTREDKPAGRGGKLQTSPVKEFADAHELPLFQPRTLRGSEADTLVRVLRPDLIVVSAYGLILPRRILAISPRGCINTHASLLPRHRGASPVASAILAGDAETGVTLMQMDEGIDTGPILAQRALTIEDDDTTGSLTTKLAVLAAELLGEHLPRLLAGELVSKPQDASLATLSKPIRKQDGLLDWNLPAQELARRVRAFDPWPSAHTFFNGAQLKILRAGSSARNHISEAGTVIQIGQEVAVACGSGALHLQEVQLAGKRAMGIEEFMRGQRQFVTGRLGE